MVSCSFSNRGCGEAIQKILKCLPPASEIHEKSLNGYSSMIIASLRRLYEGREAERSFPISFENLSLFRRRALEATMEIPRGYVSSYGIIAKKIGRPGASRAVGRAEATNPLPLIVPCHRVIRSTLELGGYGGGVEVKRMLLEKEGVIMRGDRVSRECLWTFNLRGDSLIPSYSSSI